MTASIGVSLRRTGDRPNDAEAMFRDADTAMYRAKDAGGDAVAVFDASMRQRVARRLELERELRHALDRGELHLAYQPVVRALDGRVTGMEALLRWSHPELGDIAAGGLRAHRRGHRRHRRDRRLGASTGPAPTWPRCGPRCRSPTS